MATKDLTIAMVGSGGDGVVTMGDLIAQAGARDGLYVIKTEAYGPQIRGGESSCAVRISVDPVRAPGDLVDALVVFNWADIGRFRGELVPAPDALILYEAADPTPLEEMKKGMPEGAHWIAVPFTKLAKEATGGGPGKNIVTLGILSELFNLPGGSIRAALEYRFKKKGPQVIEVNIKAFDAGGAFAKSLPEHEQGKRLEYKPGEPMILISGNEASAVGALHAGCRFFSGYPITPSSEVLHYVSEWLPRVGGTSIQTEDELSALGAAIGASFAGVKSMTATSGPGLSLMTELLGLAAITETPTVVINVQRGGPSTGLPTKSEQSDLFQAVFAGHGDMPRVVLSATDVEDSFHTTVEAFNIAEEFQVPVIMLTEQVISGRRESLKAASLVHDVVDRKLATGEELADFKRYRLTPDGVSPMSIPGMQEGIYQTNGLEHTEDGSPASMHLVHEKMNDKRYRKLGPIRDKYQFAYRIGAEKPEIGILCWGGSRGPVEEAINRVNARGAKVAAWVPRMLFPFPKKQFEDFIAGVPQLLVVELSFSAQFYKYIRTFVDLPEDRTRILKRSGGKNLTVAEIENEIARLATKVTAREEVLA